MEYYEINDYGEGVATLYEGDTWMSAVQADDGIKLEHIAATMNAMERVKTYLREGKDMEHGEFCRPLDDGEWDCKCRKDSDQALLDELEKLR